MTTELQNEIHSDTEQVSDYDVVVIGAGFSGLYMLHRLHQLGMSARVFEAGSGVGGTWFWNRYPGARCDSESMYYSYSFDPELEQEWTWSERYPGQAEILRYLNHVADRFDLRGDIQLNTRITSTEYDERTGKWRLVTDQGPVATASYCVTAVGCLSSANEPTFPGAEKFLGDSFHTGKWPPEGVDLSGKRVAVIGTGASGIQAIPVIAKQAAHLTVFQRTPNFTIPAQNRPMDPAFEEDWKAHYRDWRAKGRNSLAGIPYAPSERSALVDSEDGRRETFEKNWGNGGFSFMFGSYMDLLTSEEANQTAADFVRSKIDEIVEDPETATKLKPTTYPLGTKRLPLDTDYYATFNRPNVSLVDLRSEPIETITPSGIRTTGGDYDVDVIVYATGFDALTRPLYQLGIRGRDGVRLEDKWAEGPRTYLGLGTSGFPNLFTITGPGSPSVLTNMPVAIEQHVEWVTDCLRALREQGVKSIEATPEAEDAWTTHVQEVANATLYPKAASWYMGANIPGKTRIFMPYVGGLNNYEMKCRDVASKNYEGFTLVR